MLVAGQDRANNKDRAFVSGGGEDFTMDKPEPTEQEITEALASLRARGLSKSGAQTYVDEMIEIGYRPLDATEEELDTVGEAHKAGYRKYTVEILRANRAKSDLSLPAAEALQESRRLAAQ